MKFKIPIQSYLYSLEEFFDSGIDGEKIIEEINTFIKKIVNVKVYGQVQECPLISLRLSKLKLTSLQCR